MIDACEAMKRWASSASDISSENSATALLAPSAAFSAKLAISADLPIDGRAARMIRLPGWKPPVIASRSSKPDGVPVIDLPSRESCSSLSSSASSRSSIERKSLRRSSWATSRIARSAMSTSSRGGASWRVHARLDLVGGVQQAAQHRVLADDPRVLADVADGRDRAGQQVDRGAAADARRARRPA